MAREGLYGPNGHRRPFAPQPKLDVAVVVGAARPAPHRQAAEAHEAAHRQVEQIVDRMIKEAMAEDEVSQRIILRRSRLLRLCIVLLPLQVLVFVFISACIMQIMKDNRILLVLLERRKCIH